MMAGLAAVALLLQVLFAAPLAARMMSAVPICGLGHAEDEVPAPSVPHDHGSCLICHVGALPVALLAAAVILGFLSVAPWRADPAPLPLVRAQARRWRHAARAPPSLA